MKNFIVLLFFSQLYLCICGQTSNPFSYLTEIINGEDPSVHLYIDNSNSEIFNKKLKDLGRDHPLYTSDGCDSEMVLLAITKVNNSSKRYAIVYGYCPEPEFYFYDPNDISKLYGLVGGLNMYIPGNGNLYVTGHANTNFDAKRKYIFRENNIQELKQAAYYVGLKTKTINPITLYHTKELKNVVARLPKDYNVEVILAETTHKFEDFYLIKTDFGLLGWAKIRVGQHKGVDIKGLFWSGD